MKSLHVRDVIRLVAAEAMLIALALSSSNPVHIGLLIISFMGIFNLILWQSFKKMLPVLCSVLLSLAYCAAFFDPSTIVGGSAYVLKRESRVNQLMTRVIESQSRPAHELDLRDFLDYEVWRRYQVRIVCMTLQVHAVFLWSPPLIGALAGAWLESKREGLISARGKKRGHSAL